MTGWIIAAFLGGLISGVMLAACIQNAIDEEKAKK